MELECLAKPSVMAARPSRRRFKFDQFNGHPAVELIEFETTQVLLISSSGPKYTCTTASWHHLNMSVTKRTDY